MKKCKLDRDSMGSLPGPVVYFGDMYSVFCLYHIGHHVEYRSSCTFNVNRIALNKRTTLLLLILWNWKINTYYTRTKTGGMMSNANISTIFQLYRGEGKIWRVGVRMKLIFKNAKFQKRFKNRIEKNKDVKLITPAIHFSQNKTKDLRCFDFIL